MPTARGSRCPMNSDASSNHIYSDWILAVVRELGMRSTCERPFTTWESLEDLLELNEDARKRALKQKGGRGFPRGYNVFEHILSALIHMGCEFRGPLPAVRLCAEQLAARGVHIAQIEHPGTELGELWQRADRIERRRVFRKADKLQAANLADLLPDEAAFIRACTAIARHCLVEASPTVTGARQPGAPLNTNPCKRADPSGDLRNERSVGQWGCPPQRTDPIAGPPPLAMLLPLLRGTRATGLEYPLFDDGLGPIDYGIPSNEAELMARLTPPALAERLAEADLQPADLCQLESFSRGREVAARWLAADGPHRFAILVGRARLAPTPLCDRALLLRRMKHLDSTLADTPGNTGLAAGTIPLIIRHAQGDVAYMLAALFTALALGGPNLDLLDKIIRP